MHIYVYLVKVPSRSTKKSPYSHLYDYFIVIFKPNRTKTKRSLVNCIKACLTNYSTIQVGREKINIYI